MTALVLAVSLYGLTRDVDRELAVLAFACRLSESLFTLVAPITTLGLLWLATAGSGTGAPDSVAGYAVAAFLLKLQGWNVAITATLFAVGSLVFSWLFLRGRLIPSPLAWLGVVASVLLIGTLPFQLIGVLTGAVTQWIWLPMAAFEIPLALWLLVKGVAAPVPRIAT